MKRVKIGLVVVAVAAAVGVVQAAAIGGTNTWIGAASGGSWKTGSNWKSVTFAGEENPDPTITFNDASYYVYDFSALANGATVQNDCTTTIRIAGLLFGDNQGTVTLTRTAEEEFYFNTANVIHVGTGTTVNFNLRHHTKWNDSGANLNFEGGGDFQFAMADLYLAGSAQFNLNGGTTVSIMKTPADYSSGFYLTQINFQDDDSVLNIKADNVRFQVIKSASGKAGKVALNGYTAGIVYAGGTSIAEISFGGYFDGPGTLYVQGGNALKFTNAEPFRNGAVLKVRTDEVALGTGSAFGTGTTLEMADNGRVAISESATIKQLKGDGTMGAVTVASGKALTVGTSESTGSDTYSARLTGDGKFVKDGAGYALTLDGVNSYAGGTEVKAGTLKIREPDAPPAVADGLVAYWRFDDPDDIGKDSSGHGVALTPSRVTGSTGVIGGAAHFVQATAAGNDGAYLRTTQTLGVAGLPTGNHAISFAYWIKVTKYNSDLQASLYGSWAAAKMFLFRQNGDTTLNFTSGGDVCDLASNKSIKDGKWHHVVGTYDDSAEGNRTIYFDGVLVASGVNKAGTTMAIGTSDTFSIGESNTRSFEGDIDDYRIYDRVLSADDVREIYKEGGMKTPVSDGLVAYWNFDDSTDLGKDSSGHGVALTPTGVSSSSGVVGGAAHFTTNSTASQMVAVKTLGENGLPVNDDPVSFAFWFKASSKCYVSNFAQLLVYGTTSVGKMFWIRSSGTLEFTAGVDIGSLSDNLAVQDGKWHHLVCTYGDKTKKIYIDGAYRCQLKNKVYDYGGGDLSDEMRISPNERVLLGASSNYRFEGDIDDYRIYDRVLSQADVDALYKMSICSAEIVPAERVDEAAKLPAPVAKYTFDDSANEGKDTSGNGYDLTKVGTTTYAASRKGAYGGCVKLGDTAYFKADTFPAKVPTSGSFTLSLRMQPAQVNTPAYVFWGKDGSTTSHEFFWAGADNNQLLEQVGSFTTGNDLRDGELFSTAGGASSSTGNEATWINMVYVYNYDKKTLSAYRDGNFVMSKTYDGNFAASPDVFYLGFKPNGIGVSANIYAKCYLDDVRIFDQAFSPAQVKTLVRSLETGSVGPSLPASGTVTVDAGATMTVLGPGHSVPALEGAGTLDVSDLSSVTLGDAANFAGAVTGLGSLYLNGKTGAGINFSGFGGVMSLANNINASSAALPVISIPNGAVTLPAAGTLTIADVGAFTPKFVIAEAKIFDGETSDFSGWTYSPVNEHIKSVTFAIEQVNGVRKFVANVTYRRGTLLLIK